MTASEIRRMKIGFEHNVLPGEVFSALALIEIAAQLAEMNQAKKKLKPDTLGPYVKAREQLAEEENSYVAYLYFTHPISGEPVLNIGDSDTPGSFKVFRRRM
jgi:hypothetical protein